MIEKIASETIALLNKVLGTSASLSDPSLVVGAVLGGILACVVSLLLQIFFHPRSRSTSQSRPKEKEEDHVELIEGDYKMVFLVRMDLEMGKGKVAAQCCHAVLAAYHDALDRSKQTKQWLRSWEEFGSAKITLKCPDEPTMLEIQKKAHKLGLVARSIRDAGRTQVAPNSRTVMAIGPGPVDLVNQVTGHLKLY